jgi:tryptophan-rich sensory protein
MEGSPRDLGLLASAVGLVGFIVLVTVVASTGAIFKPGAWYEALSKPVWTPPDWLFPIAWTILYLMIAVAGWLVWRELGLAAVALGFAFYLLQLALNAAWSWLFFGLKRMDLALIDVAGLWLAIAATMVVFYTVRPIAAWLLAPYLVWVSYAAALNLVIWRMNS